MQQPNTLLRGKKWALGALRTSFGDAMRALGVPSSTGGDSKHNRDRPGGTAGETGNAVPGGRERFRAKRSDLCLERMKPQKLSSEASDTVTISPTRGGGREVLIRAWRVVLTVLVTNMCCDTV